MKFYVNPQETIEFPCMILESSNWDDYHNRTSFNLTFFEKEASRNYIGPVKIMNETEKVTLNIIPKKFEELEITFCSLGQEMSYYENLKDIFPADFEDILDYLNDAAYFTAISERFENHPTFTNSLLRFSEAEKAFKEAKSYLAGIEVEHAFEFKYRCTVDNAEDQHIMNFNFGEDKFLPNRIIALVGKNGTGKTQFLARLALDLSGKSRRLRNKEVFTPHRPLFSKIIAVSYSAFDRFSRPSKDKSFSYKYCGLKDEKGNIMGPKKLSEIYRESTDKIRELRRENEWLVTLSTIIGQEITRKFYEEIFENENYEIVSRDDVKLLSSGQNYLMYVMTEVIANIRKQSLLLFDEPEMHLHPNAIANLVRMLDKLLDRFDSYSVIATHSPIIIQEIPSNYVFVFDRLGKVPVVRKLGIESFGESIEVLTEEVFQTKDVKGTFKEVLEVLSMRLTYENVLNLFNNKLSLSAKTFLLGLYPDIYSDKNA